MDGQREVNKRVKSASNYIIVCYNSFIKCLYSALNEMLNRSVKGKRWQVIDSVVISI